MRTLALIALALLAHSSPLQDTPNGNSLRLRHADHSKTGGFQQAQKALDAAALRVIQGLSKFRLNSSPRFGGLERAKAVDALTDDLNLLATQKSATLEKCIRRLDASVSARLDKASREEARVYALGESLDREAFVYLLCARRWRVEEAKESSAAIREMRHLFRLPDGPRLGPWPWPWIKIDGKWKLSDFTHGYSVGPPVETIEVLDTYTSVRDAKLPLRSPPKKPR